MLVSLAWLVLRSSVSEGNRGGGGGYYAFPVVFRGSMCFFAEQDTLVRTAHTLHPKSTLLLLALYTATHQTAPVHIYVVAQPPLIFALHTNIKNNCYRCMHGTGPVMWSDEVASLARVRRRGRNEKRHCVQIHCHSLVTCPSKTQAWQGDRDTFSRAS